MSWLKKVLYTLFVANVLGQTNLTFYRKLPPLYTFHNYEESLARQLPSTYCLVFAQIQPDNHSELWHSIESISKDSQHRYRHDYLFFGLCVEKCREILENSTNQLGNKLLDESATPHNEIIDYYSRVYASDANNDRLRYHDLLQKCVNFEFQQKYNLTLHTFVEYCDTGGSNDSPAGNLEIITYVIIACLAFSNIFSSAYDYHLKLQQLSSNPPSKDHYSQELKNLGSSILTSFSISRNYMKIVSSNNDNDLQFTYFFRVFTMFFVIWGHALMVITAAPVANPEFVENHLFRNVSIIFQNGSTLIQIFFVLTGFLLKLKFDKQHMITTTSGYTTCVYIYFIGFFKRYLRIVPSLAILIVFNVTLLTRLGSGPFWRHMVEGERVFCTEYWWKNIFMINNFMMKESCAHQTWYLAADMQLYELYLIVLIVTSKFTHTRKPLYGFLGLLAFIVPGVLTYIYRLDASPYLHPEYYRYLYFKYSPTLYVTYYPFYCNLCGYLVGIICAEIYAKSQRFQRIEAVCKKYKHVLKVQIPFLVFILSIGFGLLFTGLLVIHNKTEEPSIWVALYASCYRNLWAVFCGFVLMSMLLKFGWIAYEMCCLAIFRVLGRLTFQMYLWHVLILRILFGHYRQTVYLTEFYVLCQIILAFILSMVVAFIMTIFVEYPICNIINCLFKRVIKNETKRDNDAKQSELKSCT